MNIDQLLKDYPNIKKKDLYNVMCRNIMRKMQKGEVTKSLRIESYIKLMQLIPNIDLKKYDPEYKELIELEINKKRQEELLIKIMKADESSGIYK